MLRVKSTPTRFPTNSLDGQHTLAFYIKCVLPMGQTVIVTTVVRTPSYAEGLRMARCRRTSIFGHFCSQCFIACGSAMLCEHVGSATGSNKWACALNSGACSDRRRTKRMVPVRFAIALQSVLQETFSNTMAMGFNIGDGLVGSDFCGDKWDRS